MGTERSQVRGQRARGQRLTDGWTVWTDVTDDHDIATRRRLEGGLCHVTGHPLARHRLHFDLVSAVEAKVIQGELLLLQNEPRDNEFTRMRREQPTYELADMSLLSPSSDELSAAAMHTSGDQNRMTLSVSGSSSDTAMTLVSHS